jgi:DNA-binding winged helix-turn-helix (wHTH) protein/tetratricopeptide (TPR) repeat protein
VALQARPSQCFFRFDAFEFDLWTGELRKNGMKLKVQEQPLKVLAMLLARPGELVTREQLREGLWSNDTFVDFDRGLITAVNRLRATLNDSAEKPRFVETVSRRGYRFIASFESYRPGEPRTTLQQSASGLVCERPEGREEISSFTSTVDDGATSRTPIPIASPSARVANGNAHRSESLAETVPAQSGQYPEQLCGSTEKSNFLRWKVGVSICAALAAVMIATGVRYRLRQSKPLTDKDTIVLADFSNSTGDPVFDDTLKTALNVSLRQSPFLNVLSDSEVAKTLQQMIRPASTKLTSEVARELCQRAGSKAYIAGSIDSLGSEYVLGLKAMNCQSGETLTLEQATAASKEKVLEALGEAASKLRSELGESVRSFRKFDAPLEQATTFSLEALKSYSLGRKAYSGQGSGSAVPFDERAIQIDSNFAMGYSALGTDYWGLGQLGRASEYYTTAFHLRDHASEREKLAIAANYYSNVTGELDKAALASQEEIESYPREAAAYHNLGAVFAYQGQYEKAAEITRQGLRLAPDNVAMYVNLGDFALALQHFDEARQLMFEAQARRLDDDSMHCVLYALAFLGADSAMMAKQRQWFAGKPDFENEGLALASDTEVYFGHLHKGLVLAKRAVDSAIRADSREIGAIWRANTALQQAAYGNSGDARQLAAEALQLAPASPGVAAQAALAVAMTGDMARAESLAQDLATRFPLHTQMQSVWLPAIHGQLALARKNPSAALSALEDGSAIELGQIQFLNNTSCLYPMYVRAESYLAAGQSSAAAAEFQKIINHSGIVWSCWTGALAHLGVARANASQARSSRGPDADAAHVRALAAYKDFLTLWKDADPGIPILKEAKAEYAKLE